ncbi:MAG: hypothetical protein VSS52_005845, partial [Thiotrichaceae bacterium]|nr:hypothetical protein [Thiotrichaceae bacterium]
LDLNNNQLTGEIPSELGNLSGLTRLFLSNNQLTGEIPNELGNLSSLINLDLRDNQLTGKLPFSLNNLISLTRWYLQNNKILGGLESLTNLKFLLILELHNNQIVDSIPKEFAQFPLKAVDLSNNQLVGEIPSEITGLSSLEFLGIIFNHLCTKDDAVIAFLNEKSSNWRDGQTNTVCEPQYIVNTETSTHGFDHTNAVSPPKLSATLDENNIQFHVSKTDGSSFQQSGNLYLKVGSFESYGANRQTKAVQRGDNNISFDSFDNSQWDNYPKMYFVRFESSETPYHAYAGPIIVSDKNDEGELQGDIVYYLENDQIIFELITSQSLDTNQIQWYLNDDLETPIAQGSTKINLPIPDPFDTNTHIDYVKCQYGQEWLYIAPEIQKHQSDFISMRNYTFQIKQSPVDKITVVDLGGQFYLYQNGQFTPYSPNVTPIFTQESTTISQVDISAYAIHDLSIYEGLINNEYQKPDLSLGDKALDLKVREQVNTDDIADLMRIQMTYEELVGRNNRATRSQLTGLDPAEVKTETIHTIVNYLSDLIGSSSAKKFTKYAQSTAKVTETALTIDELYKNIVELSDKFNEVEYENDDASVADQLKLLYAADFLFNDTPLKKFLLHHKLIGKITDRIRQLDSTLSKYYATSKVADVRLVLKGKGLFGLNKTLDNDDISKVVLLPKRIIYGDIGSSGKVKTFTPDESIDRAVRLTYQNGEYWYAKGAEWEANGGFEWHHNIMCGLWLAYISDSNGNTQVRVVNLGPGGSFNKPQKIRLYID